MHELKVSLVKELAQIDQADAKTVHIEGKNCYNNPIFNATSTTV